MEESKNSFKLPQSNVKTLENIVHAYFLCGKGKTKVGEVAAKCALDPTNVSRNHVFLISVGILLNGRDKQLTEDGNRLGIAIGNDVEPFNVWKEILRDNVTISSIIDLFKVKGQVTIDDFPRRIASVLSQSIANRATKSGISYLIELLEYSRIIVKTDNRYILKEMSEENNEKQSPVISSSTEPMKDSKRIEPVVTNKMPIENNIVLPNIHIDLQIHISPESTLDQIDKIFQSIKLHLYS
ncbi:MAG: hypothetical protein PHI32_15610 [Dysgonamonadaceae bacterium]|nr:hypothetical protein [Dysgonamonadaceae bacterium]MDD4681381.1 hypothetical protein [Clostridia bacterium]